VCQIRAVGILCCTDSNNCDTLLRVSDQFVMRGHAVAQLAEALRYNP
jgi:hypothetical protein